MLCLGLFEIWFLFWGYILVFTEPQLHFGNSVVVMRTLLTNLTLLCYICWRVCSPTVTYDWFPVIVNCDGCHMRDRICSLFPEHLIWLPLGSSWFHSFVIYTLLNLSVLWLCLWIKDWFVCLNSFVSDMYFYDYICSFAQTNENK